MARRFEITNWDGESAELYHPGGFHPTHLGDVFKQRYKIIRKLGSGSYSTVWLARDFQENCYVSIKIGTASDGHGTKLARPAITCHQKIAASDHPGTDHIVPLIDHFVHTGPNGEHPCLVLKPMGRNTNALIEKDLDTIPPRFARELSRQLVLAFDCIHSAGLAHRDVQPGNVLLGLSHNLDESGKNEEEINADVNIEIPPEDDDDDDDDDESGDDELPFIMNPVKRRDGQPLTKHEPRYIYEPCPLPDGVTADSPEFSFSISDLGAATSTITSTPADSATYPIGLRSPQVILQTHPFSYQAADIWALGLTIWEIVMCNPLLSVQSLSTSELTDDSHLQRAIIRLGPMPDVLRRMWPRADKWVDATGKPLQPSVGDRSVYHPYWYGHLNEAVWNRIPVPLSSCLWTKNDIDLFEDFIKRMLAWEEKDRATTKELLQHGWLKAVEV
ncbi:hypothetical protein ACHAPJ_011732 [Fusarium lateritium]